MTSFTVHNLATAPEGSQPFLNAAKGAYGFVPNLLGTMAEAPAILEGYMILAGIFEKTDLSETERQIILMTNNRLNGCHYCMAAHTSISQGAGVPADVIDALRTNTPIADTKLEALRTFAAVINETRGWPQPADIEAFLGAGYTRQNMLEVILGTALKVLSNYTNHVAETELDPAFAANAWTADLAEVA
ncbi:carboxymuconolactone decarboxylase family protein [Aurantiacibacter odishensis]|uniref:carboxymuconolactone decarboxylase family protein n=1 Tax=Aurantiacibacter odishensis TaxID=1155476 RepID=UPI000E7603BA|nr:carboxymuconolactone decarboxylase family protein [Aurantiacibacter odishensis]